MSEVERHAKVRIAVPRRRRRKGTSDNGDDDNDGKPVWMVWEGRGWERLVKKLQSRRQRRYWSTHDHY